MANQPQSTGSNYNQKSSSKAKAPKRGRKVKARKHKKTGVSGQKAYDNKQTAAINSLTKKVYSLEMSKYGKVQQNFHSLERTLRPTATKPLCFDLTDFTCVRPVLASAPPINGAIVYQHALVPPVNVSTASHWLPAQNDNLYWNNNNDDQPDGGAYLCKMVTYFVEVTGARFLSNTRVRFDVISQKPAGYLPNSQLADEAVLPDTLNFMKHLCEPHVNRINPVYFKKYMTKTIFINSSKTAGTKGTTANKMRFSFTLRPNKVCIQNETNPIVGGGIQYDPDLPPPSLAQQEEIDRGNFGPNNVPITQPLWCIISTDDGAGSDVGTEGVEIKISRRCVWADALGSSAL